MDNKKILGPVLVITAGVLWGLMGLFVRNLDSYGITSMQIVALRAVFTALIMACLLYTSPSPRD